MKKYFILAAAAIMISACSNDRVLEYDRSISSGVVPMNLGILPNMSVDAVATRSNLIQTGNTALLTNVGLYIYIAGQSAVYQTYGFSNIQGTKGTAANTTYGSTPVTKSCTPVTAASTLSYPDNKSTAVDIYAYAPFHALSSASGDAPADLSGTPTIGITTTANQSSSYADDDYLWGSITDGTSITAANYLAATASTPTAKDNISTTGLVVVPMNHQLSKICVNLIPSGMDISKLKGATVKIYPDYTKGTMNLKTGAVATDNTSGYDATNGNAITLTSNLGDDGSGSAITAGNDGHPNTLIYTGDTNSGNLEGYSSCGIILPQGLTTAHKFIEIILNDGNNTTYVWTPTATATFVTGKIYTYNIKVTAQALDITTLVNDWGTDTWGTASAPQEGGATLQ